MSKEREHKLIYLLVNKRDFVTAKQLADEIHSSDKTIYRIVSKINSRYGEQPLIISERGRGYKLDYQRYLDSDQPGADMESLSIVSPVERRNKIMKRLLLVAPRRVRTNELFEEYFLSASSQIADEKIIAEILQRYNLTLVKKNGYLNIVGSELNIRDAIQGLINDTGIVDLNQILNDDNFPRKYDVRFVFEQIRYIETHIESHIPYPYNLNLFSHMYILLDRARNTKMPVSKVNDDVLDKYLKDSSVDSRLLEVSQQVIKNTEAYISAKLPKIEGYYLYQYLVSSRIDGFVPNTVGDHSKVQLVTDDLIATVESLTDKNFHNSDLVSRLSEHIRPMLNRLDNHININNNLLDQIKIEYHAVFEAVKTAINQLADKYNLAQINDNEVGFLTLYFASELEKHKKHIETLIMCTTGIGTSELLKSKIIANFSTLDIVDVIATASLDDALRKYPQIKLVISTVRPLHAVAVPVVIVSAMFNMEDRKKLNEEVKNLQ
ncbi:BglG family transcription antiterminator [Lactiplantibacillus pentosus]|uniref:BglG family transcription antiterminator n=1 Tax=Lactiplantibacillus pentosus TaxID=1589 RepID=UPI001C1E1850|nr:PRD domain-containing protein [Lactiplantibacillus pentosus]MBU7502033.1 PRD domain-containing protein [Lactiplantibacillus pentosus]MCC3162818.1 PRD domain-containing protein [Lactiplantibacillus pentosus]MCJ8187992.1 PRD domain-containing protein [Lactiplantibacillus pentosus]MDY1543710.1 PRD domain-containing protein [Lactiplantibacillus pentosus]